MSRSLFAGTWELVSSEIRTASGDVHYPLGEDCIGRLMFDADGNFSAQLMRPGRPEFSSGDLLRGSDEEIRAAYEGFVSFWSKIELDEAKQELSYVVEGSLFPNWIGQSNLRYYEFADDRLTLKTPPFLVADEEVVGILTWERIG